MKPTRLSVLVLCLCFSLVAVTAGTDAEKVKADARKMIAAVKSQDVDTVLGYTHPRIIEMMGGADTARAVVNATLAEFEATGMKMDGFEIVGEPRFNQGQTHEYVVLETRMTIVAPGQKLLSKDFQFGSRPKGEKAWVYVRGSQLNEQLLGEWFPDYPGGLDFPEVGIGPLAE